MNLHQIALDSAYFEVKNNLFKIKKLGISPDTSIDELKIIEGLFRKLASGKEKHMPINSVRYFLDTLVESSALTVQEQLKSSYSKKFLEVATSFEIQDSLNNSVAEIDNNKVFLNNAKRIEIEVLEQLVESEKKPIELIDLFSDGRTHTIVDRGYPSKEKSFNGTQLLNALKEKTTTISESEVYQKNFYNNSINTLNVYEYNGLVVTVTASSPTSGKYTYYEFVCTSK